MQTIKNKIWLKLDIQKIHGKVKLHSVHAYKRQHIATLLHWKIDNKAGGKIRRQSAQECALLDQFSILIDWLFYVSVRREGNCLNLKKNHIRHNT